jgi:hypothetical protein
MAFALDLKICPMARGGAKVSQLLRPAPVVYEERSE